METSIENIDFIGSMKKYFDIDDVDANMYSPLVLAYIGDDVYDVVIRTYLVSKANMSVNKLHRMASHLVNAHTQAVVAEVIMDELTDEEKDILRRGRNAKSHTRAKNATVNDYRHATGLEALVGYLYLLRRYDRLNYLISLGIERLPEEK